MNKMKAEIAAWKQAEGTKPTICVDTSFNQAVQWLILRLTEADIPFRLIQLGAGVKRVTTETDQCPKCHGTGKC
jgi:hypothetical protein